MSEAWPVSELAGKEGLMGRELLGPGGPGPLRTAFPIGLAHLGVCTVSGRYCGQTSWTSSLMMVTPTYLTTSPSEEYPQNDHTLLKHLL